VQRHQRPLDKTETPKLTKAPQIVLPMVLCIPGDDGVRYKSMDIVPLVLRSRIERGLREMTTSHRYRREIYKSIVRNPNTYVDKPYCLRDMIIKNGTLKAKAEEIGQNEENKHVADERCIRAREPCMYLAQNNGVPTLCVVPLPEELRQGRKWREPKFWINT
jgi:hypothetical protein